MKLRVETTQVQFIVSRLATPKVERESGKQRAGICQVKRDTGVQFIWG